MIRAEADDMLAYARKNRAAAKLVFDRIYDRRNELLLAVLPKQGEGCHGRALEAADEESNEV